MITERSKKTIQQCTMCYALCSKLPAFLLLTFIFILLSISFSHATIHYVQHGQGNIPPYLSWQDAADSIQSAINVCSPGDTIIVANGVYYENLVIDSMLTLIGSSMDSTVIDGRSLENMTIDANTDINIENFIIYGKGIGQQSSIVVRSLGDSTVIKNCRILEALAGIAVAHSCIIDNVFFQKIEAGFGNIGASSGSYDYLTNNVFVHDAVNSNAINTGFGIYFIDNNIILFTGATSQKPGIVIAFSEQVYIMNNIISGFDHNIYFDIVQDTASVLNSLVLHGNTQSSGISSQNDNLSINNNVLMSNYTAVSGSDISSNYNIYWDNSNNLIGVGGQLNFGDSDRVVNPMFVRDTLPNLALDFNYHLQAYSPGIDKGDPNILDVDSSRSDIGLYGGPFGETYTYLNLAPRVPVNLSAVVSKSNNTIALSWNHNSEADTSYYNVYRDTTENFTISPANLISSPTDTFFTEPIPQGAESLYYKITAVDSDENESLPSEEIFIDIVSGISNEPITINDYRLYQNYPNPFNPSTMIGYRLKEQGKVKLMVYDITGSLVSVLVNKEQSAGYYEVEFSGRNLINQIRTNDLASGIYLYRIEVIGEGQIPRFSDMKKMILIK